MRGLRHTKPLGLAVLLLLGTATVAQAQAFQAIVHPSNPVSEMKTAQLSRLLLKTKTTWKHGGKAEPVDQAAHSKVRAALSEAVHHRSAKAVRAHWVHQMFTGGALSPPELNSDAEVIEYVRRNPNAIGYVSLNASLKGVKRVKIRD